MFNLSRTLSFVWRFLRLALPLIVALFLLSVVTEGLAHRQELDRALLDWTFWAAIVGNMVPALVIAGIVFWLAARFVRDVFKLDTWKAGLGFLTRSRFGLPGFGPWMKAEKGALANHEDSVLTRVGGPGHLVIYNDSAVVLECAGRLTRVEGPGFPKIEPFEQVYDVIDLRPKRWVYPVKAMTKDGIPITWDAEIHYQIADEGERPSEQAPYPLSRENVFKACTSRWVFVGRPTKMDWEGLMVISNTEGGLRTILARWWLNQLIGLTEEEEQAARQAVQAQLEKVLSEHAPKIGAKVLSVKLDNLQVEDAITQQWIEAWRTHWKAWSTARLARGEAAQLYLNEMAKAEAQMSLLVNIGRAFEGLTSRDTVIPHIVLSRLFSVLDRASFSASSRIFFPSQALDTLEKMRQLVGGS
jgi:hypothetical protein